MKQKNSKDELKAFSVSKDSSHWTDWSFVLYVYTHTFFLLSFLTRALEMGRKGFSFSNSGATEV
jgi:hypothetical protein